MTLVYCFKLSHVKVGDVILYDVETLVQEKNLPIVLTSSRRIYLS